MARFCARAHKPASKIIMQNRGVLAAGLRHVLRLVVGWIRRSTSTHYSCSIMTSSTFERTVFLVTMKAKFHTDFEHDFKKFHTITEGYNFLIEVHWDMTIQIFKIV